MQDKENDQEGGIGLKRGLNQSSVKTSVIIPIYNTAQYLETCVESVLAQTQKEIEIILVDDGSTDESSQIIREYEKKYSCVKAIFQGNQKLGAARNAGVELASGKYLYFLDSDDYISEDLLEQCYQTAEKGNLDFAMFDAEVFVEKEGAGGLREGSVDEEYGRSGIGIEDRVYAGMEFWEKFYSDRGIYSNAYLVYINTDYFRRNGLFFEPGVFYEDMDWVIRLYSCAERIAYIPQKLYYRRIHAGSIMTVSYNDTHMKSCIFMCRKMVRMFLAADEAARQNMVSPILAGMVGKVKEIFKVYCERQSLESIRSEVMEFYDYLLSAYEDVSTKSRELGIRFLLAAEAIREGLHSFGTAVEVPDLKLEEYKSQAVIDLFQGFPLNREGYVVGIYGTGLVCDSFVSLYQKYVGRISASLFFIDTYRKSGGNYQECPLYNIADTVGMKIDSIIIASTRYREAMLDKVRQYHSVEIDVMFVPEIVHALYGARENRSESKFEK